MRLVRERSRRGVDATDYETVTRIEGGVLALEAILDQLADE